MTETFMQWWEQVLPEADAPADAKPDTTPAPDVALVSTEESDTSAHAAADSYAVRSHVI